MKQTVSLFLVDYGDLSGWLCEHADGAVPKEKEQIIICMDCLDALDNGAEMVQESE
jgi:hypothetical protein